MNDAKLIECVRVRPALYNKTEQKYTNRDYVQQMWEEVASEVDTNSEIVKKRWAYLRDYYRKQRKTILATYPGGQAAKKRKKWPYYDAISFLDPFMECLPTYGYYDDTTEAPLEDEALFPSSPSTPRYENQESQHSTPTDMHDPQEQPHEPFTWAAEHSRPKAPPKKRIKREHNNFDMNLLQLQAFQRPEKDDDPDLHFWKGLQPLLKQLDILEAMKFKHEVHGLLIKYIEKVNSKTGHVPDPE